MDWTTSLTRGLFGVVTQMQVRRHLFRHRLVPVPTVAGGLLLAALLGVAGLGVVLGIAGFLAPTAPVGKGVFVVEGWMDGEEISSALQAYRRGRYDRLLVTGGPIPDAPKECGSATFAERGAQHLRDLGVVEPELVVIPSPGTERDRTYSTAVAVKRWIDSGPVGVTAIELASHGPHARRSRALYRMALGDGVDVGVISVRPSEYDPARWWRTSEGVKDMLSEATGYGWMLCCFRPHRMPAGPEAVPPPLSGR